MYVMKTQENSRTTVCKFRSAASSRRLDCGCSCEDCKCYHCHSVDTKEGIECVPYPTVRTKPFIESGEVLSCSECPFYEAYSGKNKWSFDFETAIAEAIAQINGPVQYRDQSWTEDIVVQWAHKRLMDEAAAKEYEVPALFGRGIVIPCYGDAYFNMAYVSAFMLRSLGCNLPIQFWMIGESDMTEQKVKQAARLDVECVDATKFSPFPRIIGGWQLKPFSIIHSPFEEVILMDADNLPVLEPTYLFDDPRYKELGSIFWPDLPSNHGAIQPESWAVAGIEKDSTLFESGQIVINKKKCWKELQIAMHMNEHSDFWYHVMYGDQNTFLFSWRKTGQPFCHPQKTSWVGKCFHHYDLDGKTVFNHCCQGKQEIINGNVVPGVINWRLAQDAVKHRKDLTLPVLKRGN